MKSHSQSLCLSWDCLTAVGNNEYAGKSKKGGSHEKPPTGAALNVTRETCTKPFTPSKWLMSPRSFPTLGRIKDPLPRGLPSIVCSIESFAESVSASH